MNYHVKIIVYFFSAMKSISDSEIDYIVRSCTLGMRNDGRGPIDYRNIQVESDIFPHCAGSSRVTIGSAVDVICGVKVISYAPSY